MVHRKGLAAILTLLVSITLGVWPAGETGQTLRNVRAEGNHFTRCDHGVLASATNGGTFSAVSLAGNRFTDCRVDVDLGGASGITLTPGG